MTTATQLAALIAVRSHDAGYKEGPTAAVADYIGFLNDAVDDWNGSGGLLRLSDASTAQVADTYDYSIPATFMYLYEVLIETETGKYEAVNPDFWYVDYRTGATPTVHIRRALGWTMDSTLHIMLAGQGHQVYFTGAETVPAEMVAYLRERGIYHALEYLSQGGGTLATSRRAAAAMALQLSADMEQKRAMSSRVRSGSIYVPGR
jgi:hypothetical protein